VVILDFDNTFSFAEMFYFGDHLRLELSCVQVNKVHPPCMLCSGHLIFLVSIT